MEEEQARRIENSSPSLPSVFLYKLRHVWVLRWYGGHL
jgi:hypothetical protein